MGESGERLFEEGKKAIEDALRFVGFRRRLRPADFEELRSYVMLKLVENDYARLRKHQGQGSMAAYLRVVVQRLYLDFQIGKWGKWHPSAEARRRGDSAMTLERLVYRDGLELHEALELMRTTTPVKRSREDLLRLAYALPVRHRPQFVGEEHISGSRATPAMDPVECRERNARAKLLQSELGRAMAALDGEDRRILEMRFWEIRTVPQIASLLGLDAKPLYARIQRLLDSIRDRLVRKGFGEDVLELVQAAAREIDLDGVFAETAA